MIKTVDNSLYIGHASKFIEYRTRLKIDLYGILFKTDPTGAVQMYDKSHSIPLVPPIKFDSSVTYQHL